MSNISNIFQPSFILTTSNEVSYTSKTGIAIKNILERNPDAIVLSYINGEYYRWKSDNTLVRITTMNLTGVMDLYLVGNSTFDDNSTFNGLTLDDINEMVHHLNDINNGVLSFNSLSLVDSSSRVGDWAGSQVFKNDLQHTIPSVNINYFSSADLVNPVENIQSKYFQDLLKAGPLIVGEEHNTSTAPDLINNLIDSGDVKRLMIEYPDIGLLSLSDIHTYYADSPIVEKNLITLKKSIVDSGANTFGEYLKSYSSLGPEQQKAVDDFLNRLAGWGGMIKNAMNHNASIYFIDSFIARKKISYNTVIAADARNKYMADAYKAIIGDGDGAGTAMLVGANHLYDALDGSLRSVWEYMGISGKNVYTTVTSSNNLVFVPHIDSVHPDLLNSIIYAYPGTELYNEYDVSNKRNAYFYMEKIWGNWRKENPQASAQAQAAWIKKYAAQPINKIIAAMRRAELLDWKNVLNTLGPDVSKLSSQHNASVHFAPQSLLLGDDSAIGICDSLSEAWLLSLSQDNSGAIKNTLLNEIFLRSQSLINDAFVQGRLPDSLSAEVQAFTDALSGFKSTGSRTEQSLDDIVRILTTTTTDISLSLHTGNHAFALARRTINGRVGYFLYDPNLGEITLPASADTSSATALKSLLSDFLSMKTGSGGQTLADYYQTDRNNGAYTFSTQTFDPLAAAASPAWESLKALLAADTPMTAPTHDTSVTLPEASNAVLSGLYEQHQRAAYVKQLQEADSLAHGQAAAIWDRIQRDLAADPAGKAGEEKHNVILDILPVKAESSDDIVVKVTWSGTDGNTHVTDVTLRPEDLTGDKLGSVQVDEDKNMAAGMATFLKSQGIYSLLTSLTGLIKSVAQQNAQGEAVNGLFLGMTVSDLTGLADKLANRAAAAFGLSGIDAFGGGVNGLLGKGASELAQLAGTSVDMAGTLGKFVSEIPLLQGAILGFTMYSDIMALNNSHDEVEHNQAIGLLATDTLTGAIGLGTGIGSMVGALSSEVAGGIGGLAAVVGILIDIIIDPDNPLGLRGLINPGSLQIESFIKSIGEEWTNKPEDLWRKRSLTDESGHVETVASFVVSGRDLPSIQTVLNHSAMDIFAPYLKMLSADELKDFSSYPEKLTAWLSGQIGNTNHVTATGILIGQEQARAALPGWIATLKQAFSSLSQNHVPDNMRLDYILYPDLALPVSADNGYMIVKLNDDGQGFDMTWTTPASYYGYVTAVKGPENISTRHVNTGQVIDDFIMGTGSTQTLKFSEVNMGELYMVAWNEGSTPLNMVGKNVTQVHDLGYYVFKDSIKIVPLDHRFQITGNARDNKFYSVWGNESQSYDYIVNGGGGDDMLFMSQYGSYTFDGGSDNAGQKDGKGDTVVAAVSGTADYVLYDLDPDAHTDFSGDHQKMRNNFSATLHNVENIVGSKDNEILHGNSGKNLIITGGGSDIVWLSGGGDQYQVIGTVRFHGQNERAIGADRDVVVLDVDLMSLTAKSDGTSIQLNAPSLAVTMDSKAQGQLIFVTKDKANLYHDDTGWVISIPDADLYGMINGLLGHIPQSLLKMTGTRVVVKDMKSTDKAILGFNASNGSLSSVLVTTTDDFSVLTASGHMKALSAQVGNIPVEYCSNDGMSFTLNTATAADKTVKKILKIVGFTGKELTVPDGALANVDVVFTDITAALQAGKTVKLAGSATAQTILRYKIGGALSILELPKLVWTTRTDGSRTLALPDGKMLEAGAELAGDVTISCEYDDGSSLTESWSGGKVTGLWLHTESNMSELSSTFVTQYMGNQPAGSPPMEVSTKDGVSFHIETSTSNAGTSNYILVVDTVDLAAFPVQAGKWHSLNVSLQNGIHNAMADITALVKACQTGKEGLELMFNGQAVFRYQMDKVLNPRMLQSWLASQTGNNMIILPDNNHITPNSASGLTLNITDTGGSNWMVSFAKDVNGNFSISEAYDLNGISPLEVLDGALFLVSDKQMTVDLGMKTGIPADLTGLHNIVGSEHNDTLSGDVENNVIFGLEGNDVLTGNGGNDVLIGGPGADRYVIKSGDKVIISQSGNGTATDILDFGDVSAEALNYAMSGQDLIIRQGTTVVDLKNWGNGDNRYELADTKGGVLLNMAQFVEQVENSQGLSLQRLQAQYQELAQQNAEQAKHDNTLSTSLSLGFWTFTGPWARANGQMNPQAGLIRGQVTASAPVTEAFDAAADYRFTVDVSTSKPSGAAGLHLRLKLGDQIVADKPKGVLSNSVDGLIKGTLELDLDGATCISMADGKRPLTVELEEDDVDTSWVGVNMQLTKLTHAMATFGTSQGSSGVNGAILNPVGPVSLLAQSDTIK